VDGFHGYRRIEEPATHRNLDSDYPNFEYSIMLLKTHFDSGRQMKEQYVGDVSDYRKYALLRALAGDGEIKIGVCWMLTPSDTSSDGSKLGYLQKPAFREFDPPLFDLLATVMNAPDKRRLLLIEESSIVPGATYYNAVVPDALEAREAYFKDALTALQSSDLIFFDPDNGLDVRSRPKGKPASSKYLFRDEVAETFMRGHSLLIYQHFPHEERVGFINRLGAELSELCKAAETWAFTTSHVVFFLVVHSAHAEILNKRAHDAAGKWDASFVAGRHLNVIQDDADNPGDGEALTTPLPTEKPSLLFRLTTRFSRAR
jgi:hypothetical protein